MRTTLTIDESIAAALKKAAYESDQPFKKVVNDTLRAGLATRQIESAGGKPYRLQPAALGGVKSGVDINKALQLADAIEDEEIVRKLRLRK